MTFLSVALCKYLSAYFTSEIPLTNRRSATKILLISSVADKRAALATIDEFVIMEQYAFMLAPLNIFL